MAQDLFLNSFFSETLIRFQNQEFLSAEKKADFFFDSINGHANLLTFKYNLTSKFYFIDNFNSWYHESFKPLNKILVGSDDVYSDDLFELKMAKGFLEFLIKETKNLIFGDELKELDMVTYYNNKLKPLIDAMAPCIKTSKEINQLYETHLLSMYRSVEVNKKLLTHFLSDTTSEKQALNLLFLKETLAQFYTPSQITQFRHQLNLLLSSLDSKTVLTNDDQSLMLKGIIDCSLKVSALAPCSLSTFLKATVKEYFSLFYPKDFNCVYESLISSMPAQTSVENISHFIPSSSIVNFLSSMPITTSPAAIDLKIIDVFLKQEHLKDKVESLFPSRGRNYIEFIARTNINNRENKITALFNAHRLGFFQDLELGKPIKPLKDYPKSINYALNEFKGITDYLKNQKRKDEQIEKTILIFDSFAEKINLQSCVSTPELEVNIKNKKI